MISPSSSRSTATHWSALAPQRTGFTTLFIKRSKAQVLFWLLASVLLHALLLGGVRHWDSFAPHFSNADPARLASAPVQVGFISLPPPAAPNSPADKALEKPAPRATPKPATQALAKPKVEAANLSETTQTASDPATAPNEALENNEAPENFPLGPVLPAPDEPATFIASDLVNDLPPTAEAGAPVKQPGANGKIEITRLPPPVRLEYDLIFTKDDSTLSGSGRLSWQYNNNGYLADISAHALIQVFRMTSQGRFVLGTGLMPIRQTEQRALRSETAVNFNWEQQPPQISFSTRTDSVELLPGTQDYASLIMQLASVLSSQAAQLQSGISVQFAVADPRQVRAMNFVLSDDGMVNTPYGNLPAWRFSYVPPADSYERSMDLWFSPNLQWLPVKIRYTDARRKQIYELLLKAREGL